MEINEWVELVQFSDEMKGESKQSDDLVLASKNYHIQYLSLLCEVAANNVLYSRKKIAIKLSKFCCFLRKEDRLLHGGV